ncbi:hypothetical protein [Streptomyces johnsoniae]|uniref:ANTAR domain-containing protein n=1 Tax=Streptomyces johnsoniae TaxID=3075532 RepID=A0ABU2S8T7_9ACTN|nr:hypothetical protein [Streptomyces sp. DSM 41886]MDT0445348.1 hypothetical protein [Streptomyces sp. DSM 41886]
MLKAADMREGCLLGAVLLSLGVPDAMLKDVARKIVGALRGTPAAPAVDKNQDNEG